MKSQFYEFNISRSVFRDARIRKAFSYAIDRKKLMDDVLKGQGTGPDVHGITPPSFPEYNISGIVGYGFNMEKAKKLLAEAGYPDGKGFPKIKLELNSGGATNTKVALEIQKQLKNNININVDLDIVSFAQKGEDAKYARADLMRSAWVADYPSPENFLYLLYGKNVPASLEEPSWPNSSRYVNPTFDSLYEKGVSARTVKESYTYFKQAEQIMLNDAPIMVLWYDENYQITTSNVKNIYINPMLYRNFSEVYLKKSKASSNTDSLLTKNN
jgi:peptide/nickel transport system substrate-binding protein